MQTSLRRLERETLQPVVPGEFGAWARGVADAINTVRADWVCSQEERRAAMQQAVDDDPNASHRVDQLAVFAKRLEARLDELHDTFLALRERTRAEPTSSEEPYDEAVALQADLLGWILEARVFEARLRGVLVEAAYRDRGVVD